jgi:pre-mRNA-splicing factor CWC22
LVHEDLTFSFLTDIFKFDPKYLENQERYKSIKTKILGEESDEESGSGSEEDDESEEEEG